MMITVHYDDEKTEQVDKAALLAIFMRQLSSLDEWTLTNLYSQAHIQYGLSEDGWADLQDMTLDELREELAFGEHIAPKAKDGREEWEEHRDKMEEIENMIAQKGGEQ